MADEVNLSTPAGQPLKTFWTIPLLLILSIFSLAISGYLFWQNQQLMKQLAALPTPTTSGSEPEVMPIASPVAQAEVSNPTVGWKTYKNTVETFSFKYPPEWTIDTSGETGDERKENVLIILTKDQTQIIIYANLVGIGGQGQTYEGKPFTLSGQNLFQFRKENTYNQTQMVGITETLKETLGVFRFDGKTYSITLSYPLAIKQTNEAIEVEKEFDQILSTFKFTE